LVQSKAIEKDDLRQINLNGAHISVDKNGTMKIDTAAFIVHPRP